MGGACNVVSPVKSDEQRSQKGKEGEGGGNPMTTGTPMLFFPTGGGNLLNLRRRSGVLLRCKRTTKANRPTTRPATSGSNITTRHYFVNMYSCSHPFLPSFLLSCPRLLRRCRRGRWQTKQKHNERVSTAKEKT